MNLNCYLTDHPELDGKVSIPVITNGYGCTAAPVGVKAFVSHIDRKEGEYICVFKHHKPVTFYIFGGMANDLDVISD